MTGRIFDIKEFSVHDGPGCRVTVFMKGCPMRCIWCHNPEGQSFDKELMRKTALCTNCGLCTKNNRTAFSRDPDACPRGALKVSGEDVESDQLAKKLISYAPQLEMMKGGVTFSGGEPLAQSGFVRETAEMLKDRGIHLALETSGYADGDDFIKTVNLFDLVLMDIKLADSKAHERYTGVPNGLILDNAKALKASGVRHVFRTPLIPGITDGEENLSAIRAIAGDSVWEKLPYNKMAGSKYPMLEREYDPKGEIR